MESKLVRRLTLVACLAWGAGCASSETTSSPHSPHSQSDLLAAARQFRSHLEAGEHDAARAMMSDDPRQWVDVRWGAGTPWVVGGGGADPWAAWDEYFNYRVDILRWEGTTQSASIVYRDISDYELLLERGWHTIRMNYLFDEAGKIDGLFIEYPEGPRAWGRSEEFAIWAATNEPDEIHELAPDGEVDPSGDHPQRYRSLLVRWRAAAGLIPRE